MGSAFLKILHWEESSEAARHTFTAPRSVLKVLIKQELKTGKVGGWRRFKLDRNDSDGFQDLVKVTARRHELKPKTQNQVPQDKRPNPADSIKPTTPISHSAAFFHFSTKTPPKKTELALLSCGGPGTTGTALISARHRYTSAFPFRPEPVLSVPAPERKEQKKEKKKREKGKKCKIGRRASRGEETKARPIQLEFSCA